MPRILTNVVIQEKQLSSERIHFLARVAYHDRDFQLVLPAQVNNGGNRFGG